MTINTKKSLARYMILKIHVKTDTWLGNGRMSWMTTLRDIKEVDLILARDFDLISKYKESARLWKWNEKDMRLTWFWTWMNKNVK